MKIQKRGQILIRPFRPPNVVAPGKWLQRGKVMEVP